MGPGLTMAASVAIVSALMGNRTAWALLCSLGASFWVADSKGLFLIDLLVLCVVLRRNMTLADELICAAFLPAWFAYLLDDGVRYEMGWACVVLQMLLCLPVRRIGDEVGIVREFVADLTAFLRSRYFERLHYA